MQVVLPRDSVFYRVKKLGMVEKQQSCDLFVFEEVDGSVGLSNSIVKVLQPITLELYKLSPYPSYLIRTALQLSMSRILSQFVQLHLMVHLKLLALEVS